MKAEVDRPAAGLAVDAPEPAPDRSQQIIAAAYELLAEEGLEGLTIRAVLKRTGLSRRAFYERFEGKDDLVLAVFEHTIQLAAQVYSEQVRKLPDPLARLEAIVTWTVIGRGGPQAGDAVGARRGAALSREHLRLAESRPNELQAALRPLISLITDQLADGIRAGLVRNEPPQRLAALVYNTVSSTVQMELLASEGRTSDPAGRDQLARDIWEFCRRAIAA